MVIKTRKYKRIIGKESLVGEFVQGIRGEIISERYVPGTGGKYRVLEFVYKGKRDFRIWSDEKQGLLLDSTRFGSDEVYPTSTYGITFREGVWVKLNTGDGRTIEVENSTSRVNLSLKDLVWLVGYEDEWGNK